MKISIARDFSKMPGGRLSADNFGDKYRSGESCRKQLIEPALRRAVKEGECLVVNLDEVAGYAAAFLDETFSPLREAFTQEQLEAHLRIEAESNRFKHYAALAMTYLNGQKQAQTR